MDEQEQLEFIQVLASVMGVQSQEEFESGIQALGEEGLKTMASVYEQVKDKGEEGLAVLQQTYQQLLQEQLATFARMGAKLEYINKLRGKCPKGYTSTYYKKGGKVCKTCAKKTPKKEEGGPFELDWDKVDKIPNFKSRNIEFKDDSVNTFEDVLNSTAIKDNSSEDDLRHSIDRINQLLDTISLRGVIKNLQNRASYIDSIKAIKDSYDIKKDNSLNKKPFLLLSSPSREGLQFKRYYKPLPINEENVNKGLKGLRINPNIPPHFERRDLNTGNGRHIITENIIDYTFGGPGEYDLPNPLGGRVIYVEPAGNDTIYWNTPEHILSGYTFVGDRARNLVKAKKRFLRLLRLANPYEDKAATAAYNRAKKEK